MFITHRTERGHALAVNKAASVKPKHREKVGPLTPTEDQLAEKMKDDAIAHYARPQPIRNAETHKYKPTGNVGIVYEAMHGRNTVREIAEATGLSRKSVETAIANLFRRRMIQSKQIEGSNIKRYWRADT